MACPCCGLCSKLDTLEGSVVNLNSRSRQADQSSGVSRRVKATTGFKRFRDLDAKAQKKLICSLPCLSHQEDRSAVKCQQMRLRDNPNVCRNIASRSKTHINPKNCERTMLAFVLHDANSTDETPRTKISGNQSDKFKPFPLKSVEMQAFHTAALHASPLSYTGLTPDNTSPIHAAKDLANGKMSDLDDSEESEHELEGAICLSSFTFGPSEYLPPSLDVVTSGKKSLVRKLSSESCISMLSLGCTDDQLSADERAKFFPSGDLSLQGETAGISVCFPEARTNIDDQANMVRPCFQFGGSGSIRIHREPYLEVKRKPIKSCGLSWLPLKKCNGITKGQPQKDLRPDANNKKRSRSAKDRCRPTSNKTRRAPLNLHTCRGLAGLFDGRTDVYRVFNLGVGIGVSYMLFANWRELKKLNLLLERTDSLVNDILQQAPCRTSPLLGCFPNSEASDHREPENHVGPSKSEVLRADDADESMVKSMKMDDLEAALEVELALMQQNLEAECQVSPGGSDEKNSNDHASPLEDLSGSCGQRETSVSSTKKDTVNVHHMVSPNTLKKRLHEVLEVQQEERIMHLEAQVEARDLDLLLKEKELQCWKDIAHHLVNALPAKSGRTEVYTYDQGLCLATSKGGRSQECLSSVKHDARYHQLPLKCKDFKVGGSTTAHRRGDHYYELPARSDSFCESLNDSLIDPSFEALTLRNSLDWSVGAQSVEAESRKEGCTLSSRNDQDVCDLFKDLDVDKMFPWLLHDEECLEKAPHFDESSPMTSSGGGLQGGFVRKDSYCLNR